MGMPFKAKQFLSAYGIYFILAGGFFLRLLVMQTGLDAVPRWDEVAYVNRAKTILENLEAYRDLFRPPLYPAFVAGVFYFGGVGRVAIGIAQALVGTVSMALVYRLTLDRFSRKGVALVAALFCALYVEFVTLTRLYLTETLFVAFALGAFLVLERALHSSRGRTALLAGALWVLAALTREVVIHFVLIVIPVWFVLAVGWRRASKVVIPFLIGVVLVLTPWIVRNYVLEGRFILIGNSGEFTLLRDNVRVERRAVPPTDKSLSLKQQMRRELRAVPAAERGRYVTGRLVEVVSRYPAQWLQQHAIEVRQFWGRVSMDSRIVNLSFGNTLPEQGLRLILAYSPLLLMLLAVIGIFASRDNAPKLLYVLFVLYTLAVSFLTHYQGRFRVPMIALALPYAAFGLYAMVTTIQKPETLRSLFVRPRAYVGLGVLALFLVAIVREGF